MNFKFVLSDPRNLLDTVLRSKKCFEKKYVWKFSSFSEFFRSGVEFYGKLILNSLSTTRKTYWIPFPKTKNALRKNILEIFPFFLVFPARVWVFMKMYYNFCQYPKKLTGCCFLNRKMFLKNMSPLGFFSTVFQENYRLFRQTNTVSVISDPKNQLGGVFKANNAFLVFFSMGLRGYSQGQLRGRGGFTDLRRWKWVGSNFFFWKMI